MVKLDDGTLKTVEGAVVKDVQFKRFNMAGEEVVDTQPYAVVDGGYIQRCEVFFLM
jgi:hypothetical protein